MKPKKRFKIKSYKFCAVPKCISTTSKTPEKLFAYVPQNLEVRHKWLKLAGRNPDWMSPTSALHFCEDHFDMPNDMANYMQYHIMGQVSMVKMKPGVMPTKFECQQEDNDYLIWTGDTTEESILPDIIKPGTIKSQNIDSAEPRVEYLTGLKPQVTECSTSSLEHQVINNVAPSTKIQNAARLITDLKRPNILKKKRDLVLTTDAGNVSINIQNCNICIDYTAYSDKGHENNILDCNESDENYTHLSLSSSPLRHVKEECDEINFGFEQAQVMDTEGIKFETMDIERIKSEDYIIKEELDIEPETIQEPYITYEKTNVVHQESKNINELNILKEELVMQPEVDPLNTFHENTKGPNEDEVYLFDKQTIEDNHLGNAADPKAIQKHGVDKETNKFEHGVQKNKSKGRKQRKIGVGTKIKLLRCEFCDKAISNLSRHLKTVHAVLNPFRCYCGEMFPNNDSLETHKRIQHNKQIVKKTLCGLCNKVFSDIKSRNRHKMYFCAMNINKIQKPPKVHKCGICQTNFTRTDSLKKHLRIQHNKFSIRK